MRRRDTRRRKTRKLKKQKGGNLTLYHGSPNDIEEFEPRVPRSNKPWQQTSAVYLTSNIQTAKLYAIARDSERKNKGWAIRDGNLWLRKDLWDPDEPTRKYFLNETGWLYTFENVEDAEQNPEEPEEFKISHTIHPTSKEEVKKEDIAEFIVYKTRAEMNMI